MSRLRGQVCCCVLVGLSALAVFTPVNGRAAPDRRNDPAIQMTVSLEGLLASDLVVRGTISSFDVVVERVSEAIPMWPGSIPEGAMTNVARGRIAIHEVLRGVEPGDTVAFVVYVSMSHVKSNYEVGHETVLSLVWRPDVLGGMYWMSDDHGRFVRTRQGWEQQAGSLVLPNLDAIRSTLSNVAPRRLVKDSDAVVIGTLGRDELSYHISPDGQEYALLLHRLTNLEVLKGSIDETEIEIRMIASGDYWPSWRDNSALPRRLKRGERYCFFLLKADVGFVAMQGVNGIYEVRGEGLKMPGSRSAVVTVDEVRSFHE